MPRRILIATAPTTANPLDITGRTPSRSSVEDAVRRVTRDLEDMSQRYVRDGWAIEGEVTWDLTPGDNIVVGKLAIHRD